VAIVTHPAYGQTSVATREQGEEIMRQIDAQIDAMKREQNTETDEQKKTREAKEREERELEEQAEKARVMTEYRLRSQRRHMIDNIINNL